MKSEVIKIIQKVLDKNKIKIKSEEIEKLIETPPTADMGDFAFPCFSLASKLKMSPNEIAEKLREQIGNPPSTFEDIQAVGPYINFFIDRKEFALNLISEILKQKDDYGSFDLGKEEKILIEHTSINPNASPHVGRARNAIIGDSLVRIFKFLNFKPEVHYFVNDVSKQIAMLVLAKAEKLKFDSMLKKYVDISSKVSKSKELEKQVFEILRKFEDGEEETQKKFKKIIGTCVAGQRKILSELEINYDFFDYESDFLKDASKIFSQLEKSGKLFEDEYHRMVLDLKGTSIEGQMKSPVLVLTRGDKTGLYPLRDIAYTLHKLKIAEKNLIVLGEDQKLYFQQIKEALKLINSPSPEVVHYSFILLTSEGKSKKMSTRKGEVVLLEDFLKEAIEKAKKEIEKRGTSGEARKIGIAAVKYSILKNSNNKIINFNLDESLNFEGDTGPYLQYSYARASSILKKSKSQSNKEIIIDELEPKEIELIKHLSNFAQVVQDAYTHLNPSLIANYSYKLSQIFNEFYHECPVIGSDAEIFRLALVDAFKQVMKNSLFLLGISVLEKM